MRRRIVIRRRAARKDADTGMMIGSHGQGVSHIIRDIKTEARDLDNPKAKALVKQALRLLDQAADKLKKAGMIEEG